MTVRLSADYAYLCRRGADGGLGKVATLAEAEGVLFTCPCGSGHAVICWFVGKVPDDLAPGPGRWTPSGTNIDDLTLRPSVHLVGAPCGWHGFVRDGAAVPA